MMHKVYMRDWYFNAGIAGFLKVVTDDTIELDKHNLVQAGKLVIGDNYIEFDNTVLEGFAEKYIRMVFLKFFDIDKFKSAIKNGIDYLTKQKEAGTKITKLAFNEAAYLSSATRSNFLRVFGLDLEGEKNWEMILEQLQKTYKTIGDFDNLKAYDYLLNRETILIVGSKKEEAHYKDYISYYLSITAESNIVSFQKLGDGKKGTVKGKLIGYKFDDYFQAMQNIDYEKKLKNQDLCLSCQQRKASEEFSNSVSNVIGFNTDNSNWIWGYQTSNLKICSVCATIYSCAALSFPYIKRNSKEHFYYLNRNVNVTNLYRATLLFESALLDAELKDRPFYAMARKVSLRLLQEHAEAIDEGFNFIEMSEGGIGGQSTKSYHVFSYNISAEVARFLVNQSDKQIPKGWYQLGKTSIDVTEKLVQKTIEQTLSYSDLNFYFQYKVREEKGQFSIDNIRRYVFSYINHFAEGGNMNKEKMEKLSAKAFNNGKEVRTKLLSVRDNENKIRGMVYQMLNDLKISDRPAFLDKYMRACMAYGVESAFGSHEEMTDIDAFLQFGYSFVNGLMNSYEKEEQSGGDK